VRERRLQAIAAFNGAGHGETVICFDNPDETVGEQTVIAQDGDSNCHRGPTHVLRPTSVSQLRRGCHAATKTGSRRKASLDRDRLIRRSGSVAIPPVAEGVPTFCGGVRQQSSA